MTNEEVVQQALHLPEPDRAELALQLIRSLNPGDVSEEEAREAWLAESKRRAEAYDCGDMAARPWKDVRDESRARLS